MRAAPLEPIQHAGNIDAQIERYISLVEYIPAPASDLNGLSLLSALKRRKIGVGPYPDVTLFEAANRIMTDLVLLYGVRWLLKEKRFPFTEYEVEFGHGNQRAFDLIADDGAERLVGEAFNVAPSFFQTKKTAMLKKLRQNRQSATHTLILCNADAVHGHYVPQAGASEYHLFVDVTDGSARLLPERDLVESGVVTA